MNRRNGRSPLTRLSGELVSSAYQSKVQHLWTIRFAPDGPARVSGTHAKRESAALGLLNDRVCLVSGAGQGLGRSVSLEMAAEGAKVVLLEGAIPTPPRPFPTR